MVSFKKTGDSHLLSGIELSDVAQPARQRAGAASVQTETQAQTQSQDRVETPSITVSRGLSRKQKLGLGIAGMLGAGAVVGGFAWGGVETHKNQSLRGTNRLLNNQLAKQTAATERLQAQLADRTTGSGAAAIGSGPRASAPVAAAPAAVPPPSAFRAPPPAPSFDDTRAFLASTEETVPAVLVQNFLKKWNGTDPTASATPAEAFDFGALTYSEVDVPVFANDTAPSLADISINMGNPAAYALDPETSALSEYVGGAVAAIVAANPEFIKGNVLPFYDTVSGESMVNIPLSILERKNPTGFTRYMAPTSTRVLTDNDTYVRGIQPLRTLEDPETGEMTDIRADAALWYPLIEKQMEAVLQAGDAFGIATDVPSTMQALTGQIAQSADLTRLGDPDVAWFVTDSQYDAETAEGLLLSVPSQDFDANIANLAANVGQRAATFKMRLAYTLQYMPNATTETYGSTSYANGLLIEPAMGGSHIHVKTDNGTVNEILFNNRNYAFVAAGIDGLTGDLAEITLADPTGFTIDCNEYDSYVSVSAQDADAPINWGVYGGNVSILQEQAQDASQSQPLIWNSLPLKSGVITLPYNVFKQVAMWTDQVNVPYTPDSDDSSYKNI